MREWTRSVSTWGRASELNFSKIHAKVEFIKRWSTHWSVLGTKEHPRCRGRRVLPLGRPTKLPTKCARKRLNTGLRLAVIAPKTHDSGIEPNTKGKLSCSRNPGFSQQSHLSPWQVASSLTSNAPLSVLPLVRSLRTLSAQIRLQRPSQALLLACSATMPASAAHLTKTFRATTARTTSMSRRRGMTPAAVLRSKELTYV